MIRQEIIDAISRYINDGIEPGGFVSAVLANDLMEAFGRADDGNRANLFEICCFVYNDIPSNCHGSYDAIRLWIATGGINGQQAAALKRRQVEA